MVQVTMRKKKRNESKCACVHVCRYTRVPNECTRVEQHRTATYKVNSIVVFYLLCVQIVNIRICYILYIGIRSIGGKF